MIEAEATHGDACAHAHRDHTHCKVIWRTGSRAGKLINKRITVLTFPQNKDGVAGGCSGLSFTVWAELQGYSDCTSYEEHISSL
jgi:hypothetical protein